MIKEQLLAHWSMCKVLRLPDNPKMQALGTRFFAAKKSYPLDDPIEQKAVNFVTEVAVPIKSQMR